MGGCLSPIVSIIYVEHFKEFAHDTETQTVTVTDMDNTFVSSMIANRIFAII
jgi:hypothetical protein